MLRPEANVPVYLYTGIVDMRKSINGLAAIVEQELELNPMTETLFVFCNRGRDKIKMLYWERNGFVLWYKRLEKQRFKWLQQANRDPVIARQLPCPVFRQLTWPVDSGLVFGF